MCIRDSGLTELTTIEVDNAVATRDWDKGGRYEFSDATLVEAVDYAFDKQNLYLRVSFLDEVLGNDNVSFDLYLGFPAAVDGYGLSRGGAVLGFEGSHVMSWSGRDPVTMLGPVPHAARPAEDEVETEAGFDGSSIEFALPIETLPAVEAGDQVSLRLVETSGGPEGALLPQAGPGYLQVPDISDLEPLVEIADQLGDDHGPGTYTYPQDVVFVDGSYDLAGFSVGLSGGDTIVFGFEIDAPIANPWDSPAGYSIQTFDVYIDTDPGAGTGARVLLPGRNAALGEGNGWEYGLTLEGWDPALYVANTAGESEETKPTFKVIADPEGRVTARLPLELFGNGDPSTWGYAVVLMSQEGFPSSGVRRIRDIETEAEQWRGGGAPDDANHTRIFDVLHPDAGVQEEMLGDYRPASSLDGLEPDDYPQVPLILPQ